METINELLGALDNKVPASIAKRLEGLKKLNEKLASAKSEHNENPTEASQESLDEIIDFINDTEEDLADDLQELVEQKRNADLKNQEEAKKRVQAQSRAKREADEKAKKEALELNEKELEKKQLEEKSLESDAKTDTEKKSGIGWGSLLLGGALLVLTGGAIKYFGNNR
jgi:septal ring factor EnvC (AmiA/AmiB activator)